MRGRVSRLEQTARSAERGIGDFHDSFRIAIGCGEEAANKLRLNQIDARSIQLDVIDQKTIDFTGKQIESEFGKLDILVNNAGIASDGDRLPPSQVEIETL